MWGSGFRPPGSWLSRLEAGGGHKTQLDKLFSLSLRPTLLNGVYVEVKPSRVGKALPDVRLNAPTRGKWRDGREEEC
jgi:hypothetical protein